MPATTSLYTGLSRKEVIQVALELEKREVCKEMHDYVSGIRDLVAGRDEVMIPESHRTMGVEPNHTGGLVLDERISQGAAWLSSAEVRMSVAAGDLEHRDAARRMEKFAYFGEKRLSKGTRLHNWKQEANRDLFECGLSVVQHHADAGYYNSLRDRPTDLAKGVRIDQYLWRRRIDPVEWWWAEDNRGELAVGMIGGYREVGAIARASTAEAFDRVRQFFDWGETPHGDYRTRHGGKMVRIREINFPDKGYLIVWDRPSGRTPSGYASRLAEDNPDRIVAEWRNDGKVPHYPTFVGSWPPASPLDKMAQLTPSRNFWETMLDIHAAGGIFRHWQLVSTSTGETLSDALWRDAVPEHMVLDLSKPPPDMGPGRRWEPAPYEFVDVQPRHDRIVAQHEQAGASVARLMGQMIGPHTPVGTADQIEDYARREFWSLIESYGNTHTEMWEDTFRHIKNSHRGGKVYVAARMRSEADAEGSIEWFTNTLELSSDDIVSEDVEVTIDTRSRLARIADYTLGREMQNNGDIGYERRVEQGLVPYVHDSTEEKGAIFVDGIENMILESKAGLIVQEMQANASPTENPATQPPPPLNVTRGARTDPRGTGTGPGPLNISDTGLEPGAERVSA